ncbi:hypothetical protein [Mycolicibacterium poriferae]|uniref:hypothetical protein n=1 Tax=Mycolicibacterium poriferae TaxID=39694 RepID=UPI0024B898D5|nr:hypothetical protein [Mycolicibacterium poriferae]
MTWHVGLVCESNGKRTGGTVPHDKDGKYVEMQDAYDAWEPFAVEILLSAARRYHGFVTYTQLADYVKDKTGITHNALVQNWVGHVLGRVIKVCTASGWPQLTSLCVTSDGTVGPGYKFALVAAEKNRQNGDGEPSLDDLDDHAAKERFECYKFFGAELPPDGGRPALTPKAQASREYKRAQAKRDEPPKFCPEHPWITLPTNGVCDDCA